MAETHKRSKWSQVEFSADDAARSFELGATWANEQNAAEIARLEAEKAERKVMPVLTEEQIEQFAFDQYGGITDAFEGIILGATWANEQNAAEIARLEAEKAEILDALRLLFDEQNDAPLEKRRAQWEYAYKIAGVILKKYEK